MLGFSPLESLPLAVADTGAVLARPVVRRAASLMDAVAAAFGATPEEMDALFGIGAQQA